MEKKINKGHIEKSDPLRNTKAGSGITWRQSRTVKKPSAADKKCLRATVSSDLRRSYDDDDARALQLSSVALCMPQVQHRAPPPTPSRGPRPTFSATAPSHAPTTNAYDLVHAANWRPLKYVQEKWRQTVSLHAIKCTSMKMKWMENDSYASHET